MFARAERPYWFVHPYLCGYYPPLHTLTHTNTLTQIELLTIVCAYVAQPSCCLQQLALGLRIFHACCMQYRKLFSYCSTWWYDVCKCVHACLLVWSTHFNTSSTARRCCHCRWGVTYNILRQVLKLFTPACIRTMRSEVVASFLTSWKGVWKKPQKKTKKIVWWPKIRTELLRQFLRQHQNQI